jgi:hypothetical protein
MSDEVAAIKCDLLAGKVGGTDQPVLSKKAQKRLAKRLKNKERKKDNPGKRKAKNERSWSKAKKAKVDAEVHPGYLFEKGMRCLKPYSYCFETFAKQRWYGRQLLEVCNTEYGGFTSGYFEAAIEKVSAHIKHYHPIERKHVLSSNFKRCAFICTHWILGVGPDHS